MYSERPVDEPLTKRDKFAMAALGGLIANGLHDYQNLLYAREARMYADELIRELNKSQEELDKETSERMKR